MTLQRISLLMFLSWAVGAALSSQALGDDLEEIQASFQAEVNAFNAHDRNAFLTSAHQAVVVYGTASQGVIRGKAAFQQVIREYFATHANVYFTPVFADFRVIGSTALAWGHYTLSDISLSDLAKDGPLQMAHGRYTFTYAKTDRGWRLVALYFSPLHVFSPTDATENQ